MNTMNIARDPQLVEPKLEDLRIPYGGMKPFLSINDPDIYLDQAFSLAKVLENYWSSRSRRS
mgnify:CR=1 FL=1